MSKDAFLAHFITEPIYLIKNDKGLDYVNNEDQESSNVDEPEEELISERATELVELTPLTTSGKNLKNCIILTDWTEVANGQEKELLLKILSSVERIEDDVLIVHAGNASNEDIEAVLAEHNHKHVIDFGTDKLANLSSTASYTSISEGAKKFLKANELAEIAADVEKKKALWTALQAVFIH